MGIREKIENYIAKGTQASKILGLFLKKKYVTNSDIINFECEHSPIVFTTCPQKIIETLRKDLGYNLIKDKNATYKRVVSRNGKQYTNTITYKRYFLNFEGV